MKKKFNSLVCRVAFTDTDFNRLCELLQVDSSIYGFIEVDATTGEVSTPEIVLCDSYDYYLEAEVAGFIINHIIINQSLIIDDVDELLVDMHIDNCSKNELLDTLHDSGLIYLHEKKAFISSLVDIMNFYNENKET